ncbi:hypothetical protein B0T20DRAFT_481244 [Sordaria brevicollis]|uniref:Uncharacterized protein n=1 Tax=Sordaria brevicollis TaxID=83679 RepID=A0AAE0PAL2_SORBR|nr:hypothetical protein B0T20DRAFT_481244 [Sordaria brevicollis]
MNAPKILRRRKYSQDDEETAAARAQQLEIQRDHRQQKRRNESISPTPSLTTLIARQHPSLQETVTDPSHTQPFRCDIYNILRHPNDRLPDAPNGRTICIIYVSLPHTNICPNHNIRDEPKICLYCKKQYSRGEFFDRRNIERNYCITCWRQVNKDIPDHEDGYEDGHYIYSFANDDDDYIEEYGIRNPARLPPVRRRNLTDSDPFQDSNATLDIDNFVYDYSTLETPKLELQLPRRGRPPGRRAAARPLRDRTPGPRFPGLEGVIFNRNPIFDGDMNARAIPDLDHQLNTNFHEALDQIAITKCDRYQEKWFTITVNQEGFIDIEIDPARLAALPQNSDILDDIAVINANDIDIEELDEEDQARLREIMEEADKIEVFAAPDVMAGQVNDIDQLRAQLRGDPMPDPNFAPIQQGPPPRPPLGPAPTPAIPGPASPAPASPAPASPAPAPPVQRPAPPPHPPIPGPGVHTGPYYIRQGPLRSQPINEFQQVIPQLNTNNSIKQFAAKFMNKLVAERNWSAQEVCHILLELPLQASTRVVVFIDCRHRNQNGIIIANPNADLFDTERRRQNTTANTNDEAVAGLHIGANNEIRPSRSVYQKYQARGNNHTEVSYFEFLTTFDTNAPNPRPLSNRAKHRVLNYFPVYSSKDDPKNYIRIKLMLQHPHRRPDDLFTVGRVRYDTYTEAFAIYQEDHQHPNDHYGKLPPPVPKKDFEPPTQEEEPDEPNGWEGYAKELPNNRGNINDNDGKNLGNTLGSRIIDINYP